MAGLWIPLCLWSVGLYDIRLASLHRLGLAGLKRRALADAMGQQRMRDFGRRDFFFFLFAFG